MDINTLYVQAQGSFRNEAILFLHAFPLSSDMWKDQMQLFSKTHYTLAPDLPGFGKGMLPIHAIMFEHYVDTVLSFLKQSGIKKSIWCGLSMGGYVAMRLYERAPELCMGLILANTKAPADDNSLLQKRWGTIKKLHSHRDEFTEAQWQAMVSPQNLENNQLRNQFNEIVDRNSEEGISVGLTCLANRLDLRANISKITVPTLLIAGSDDKVIPLSEMEFLQESIAGSRLEVLEGAGHLTNMERPEKFNNIVSEFLAQVHTMNIQNALMNGNGLLDSK